MTGDRGQWRMFVHSADGTCSHLTPESGKDYWGDSERVFSAGITDD